MKILILLAAITAFSACETVTIPTSSDVTPPPGARAPENPGVAPMGNTNIDPTTGLRKNAVVTVLAIEDKVVLFFVAARTSAEQLAPVPTRLCAARGLELVSSEIKDLEHPEDSPGVRKLVAICQ